MKRTGLRRTTRLKPRPTSMRPHTGLSGPTAPRKPLPKIDPIRKAKEHLRAYGEPERIAWIASQPSVLSGKGPCQNVHVRGGGASRKADARWIVPLTEAEHRELHQYGQHTFEATHRIDLHWWAQVIDARWEQWQATHSPETP